MEDAVRYGSKATKFPVDILALELSSSLQK